MNLRHLRTFVVVADAGGFAAASTKLNLSQSAASRQIQALEAELRVMLFDRIGRRVHLTSEGEDLLRRSRRLLAEADSLAERARALEKGEKTVLEQAAPKDEKADKKDAAKKPAKKTGRKKRSRSR